MEKRLLHLVFGLSLCLLGLDALAQHIIQQGSPIEKLPETLVTEGNIFVKAIASKTNCFVNEPVLVTYKFYSRLQGQAKVSQLPTFTGCSVQEMGSDNTLPEIEEVNGKPFKTYIVRKVQLYPLHAGDMHLEPASVETVFSVYNKGTTLDDIKSGKAITSNRTVTISSPVVTIHVADFPNTNRPPSFDGAIGNFTIKATVGKHNDTANENNSLQIIIEGEGCFQNISCPTVTWPKGVEAFEPTTTEMVNKVTFPASGEKVFDIPFVAKQRGKLTIPAISFSFYDMQEHVYKTVTAEPIDIDVADAKASNIDGTKTYADITNRKYIWIVPAIALVAGLSLWLFFKLEKKKDPKELVKEASEMINSVTQLLQEKEAAREETYTERLNKLLLCESDNEFFGEAKKLCQQLINRAEYANKQPLLQQIMNDCNTALYGGGTVNKDDMLKRLEGVIA